MRDRLHLVLEWVLELPPKYFYVGWVVVLMLVILVVWRTPNVHVPTEVESALEFSLQPDIPDRLGNRYDAFRESAHEETRLQIEVSEKLRQLEIYVRRYLSNESPRPPVWISNQFEATGIDRDTFKARFSGSPVRVERWLRSGSEPRFGAANAIQDFLDSCFGPWNSSADFRITIKPWKTKFDSQKVSVDILIEAFGKVSPDDGRQATAIWKSDWNLYSGSLQLESLAVIAQEQVATSLTGGQLFQDSTASILTHCESASDQLAWGLDQWARKIPWLNIVGENGLSVGDINQDGLDDLYICQPHGLPNLLLIQNPDGTVEDVGKAFGVDFLDHSYASLIIDLDNDRDQDLVIVSDDSLLLVSNKGDGTFQLEHRLRIGRGAMGISAADFDQDGDLDLFLTKYAGLDRVDDLLVISNSMLHPKDGGRNVLLRNDEGWKFTDVTEQCGLTADNDNFSKCAVWIDVDKDGDQDLYVTNEYSNDQFFRNDGGWFSDETARLGMGLAARHRTASVGEFNGDGKFDLFVGTDSPLAAVGFSRIAADTGNGREDQELATTKKVFSGENQIWFSDEKSLRYRPFFLKSPLFSAESAFGSVAADINNDGLDDVIVANGFLSRSSTEDVQPLFNDNLFLTKSGGGRSRTRQDVLGRAIREASDLCRAGYSLSGGQHNRAFLSLGTIGFANVSGISGIDFPDDARAVASTDWDGDGDVDIIMTCRTAPRLRIFRNQLVNNNRFLAFDLIGTTSNRDAIGTRLELFLKGQTHPLIKTLQAGSGFLAQSSKRIMFGIGEHRAIEKLIVTWPDGNFETFRNLVADSRYRIVEGQGELAEENNERFEMAITGLPLDSKNGLPDTGRSVLYPRTVLPDLTFQGMRGKYLSLHPVDGNPMVAVFVSRGATSDGTLQAIGQARELWANSGLDCVAIYCDSATTDADQLWEDARTVITQSEFPFRWGALTPASIDKLKYHFGDLNSNHELPQFPFAMLLDESGQLIAQYPTGEIDLKTLSSDLRLISSDEHVYREFASPFPGRWAARHRVPNSSRLVARLGEVGYSEDTEKLTAQTHPFLANLLCQKAIELDAGGDTAQARGLFEKAISIDPNCVMAFIGTANLLRRLASEEQDAKSKSDLLRQAEEDLAYALAIDPFDTEAITGRADVAIAQRDLEKAIDQLSKYIEIDPERYEIHAILGRLCFRNGEHKKAAEHLVLAFDNRPSLAFVAGDLGFLYLNSGDYERARKFLLLGRRLQPSEPNILRLLAEAQYASGNHESAVELFEIVTREEPMGRRPKMILAWLLATCPFESKRDGERSLEIISPLVEVLDDQSPQVLEIYAAGLAETGQFKKALEAQDKAVALVESRTASEKYSATQRVGLLSRQELYRRKRRYRTSDVTKNPVLPPGSQ